MLCEEYIRSLPCLGDQMAAGRGYDRERLLRDIAEAIERDPGRLRVPVALVLALLYGDAADKWRSAVGHTATDLTKIQNEVRALLAHARTYTDQIPEDKRDEVIRDVRRGLSTDYAG